MWARASLENAGRHRKFSLLAVLFLLQQTLFGYSSNMKPATLRPFLPRPAIRRRPFIYRKYAVQAPGNPTLQIFDRHTKYLQKERAAANVERSRQVDYLKDEVAARLSERLLVRLLVPIDLSRLTWLGYKPTIRPCSRPWREFLQHSTSSDSARSISKSFEYHISASFVSNCTPHSCRFISSHAVPGCGPSLQSRDKPHTRSARR